MKCAQQQEKLVLATKKLEAVRADMLGAAKSPVEPLQAPERVSREMLPPHPKAGPFARFVLGWVCGCVAMALTVLVLPPEIIHRILSTFRNAEVRTPVIKTTAELEAWRKETLEKKAAEMAQFEPQHALAKSGSWRENELVLSGHSQELPFGSPQYMQLLVWLHLDPPKDEEVRMHVCKLLLERVKTDAISLWEVLDYPGSANAAEIKNAARNALTDSAFRWSDEEKKRLSAIAGDKVGTKSASTAGGKK